ncbi:MAG: hypothetical protein L0216_13700 [Planctomycetales bacterium]|nr:hypothetical protein [Planctomycetales bacterium]
MSRLGERDDGYTARVLQGIAEAGLAAEDAAVLTAARGALRARLAAAGPAEFAAAAQASLERAAWAALSGEPLAGDLEAEVLEALRAHGQGGPVRKALERVATGYHASPDLFGPDRIEDLSERVRALARRLVE